MSDQPNDLQLPDPADVDWDAELENLPHHEILIDIPGFNKTPEVDLKVFYGHDIPSDKTDPLTFDDPEVTRLRDSLLHNFEDQAKIFRIFCIDDPDLRALVGKEAKRHLS